jgi:alpha-methylacyl-CoA racemase
VSPYAAGPLSGLKIVDTSALSPGPFATMILADLGAEVIVVESPVGHVATQPDEQVRRNPMQRNKSGVILNLKSENDRQKLYDLVKNADVFVESSRPGVAARLGVDFDSLREKNPGIIYCSVTGYGQKGPWSSLPGHDINYLAAAGALSLIGDTKPVPPLNFLADYGGGSLYVAVAILASLFRRSTSSDWQGEYIDHALTDGVISLMTNVIADVAISRKDPGWGEHRLAGSDPFYTCYECSDGKWISVAAIEPKFSRTLVDGLGLDRSLFEEPLDQIGVVLTTTFRTRSRDEWFDVLQRAEACVAPVLSITEVIDRCTTDGRHIIDSFGEDNPLVQVSPMPRMDGASVTRLGAKPQSFTDQKFSRE